MAGFNKKFKKLKLFIFILFTKEIRNTRQLFHINEIKNPLRYTLNRSVNENMRYMFLCTRTHLVRT